VSRREVCRRLGVGYNSTYRWQARLEPAAGAPSVRCFRCLATDRRNSISVARAEAVEALDEFVGPKS